MFKKIIQKTEAGYDKIKYKIKNKLNLFDHVFIYPYRGFGNETKAFIRGRILEKEKILHKKEPIASSFWNNIRKTWKRYRSDEVPGVKISAEFMGIKASTMSDNEGYFNITFEGLDADIVKDGWYHADLYITHMPFDVKFEEHTIGEILISGQKNSFGIISDIDDTILQTDLLSPLKLLRNTITRDADKRVAFKGVPKLYKALSQDNKNPLLFVSGSSYNLYDMLISFCKMNDIPKAPLLLRDLGIGSKQWIKQDAVSYKTQNIEIIFLTYPKLNFILIGDSGQEDPEIYLELHRKHPGKIKAIYIRHVHSDIRRKKIEEMTEGLDIPFLLMKDSKEALTDAMKRGWI